MTQKQGEVDVLALRALAQAATPGPWEHFRDPDYERDAVVRDACENELLELDLSLNMENDAAFIAAANPRAVITLLDALETARTQIEADVHTKDMLRRNHKLQCEKRNALLDRIATLTALAGEACDLAVSFDVHGSQPGERDRIAAIRAELGGAK